ncbi:hypothetical protein DD556_10950 [Phaeobacter sp. JL2872]|nr:hypothetical protein DD556_10950 [Phaeobacter sp. JL2872]
MRQQRTPTEPVRDSVPGSSNLDWRLGDRGHNADCFREALQDNGIRTCPPGRKQQQTTARYEEHRDKQRNHIEIMFGRLKDWRRVTNNYDRCPNVFFSPIALAATVTYFCNSMHPEPRPIGSISGCQRDARHAPITMSPP